MLRGMKDRNRDTWYLGCGWHWENASTSVMIMDSLAKRGLVTVSYPHGVDALYTLTDAGRAIKV